jgi:ribonuclease HIII
MQQGQLDPLSVVLEQTSSQVPLHEILVFLTQQKKLHKQDPYAVVALQAAEVAISAYESGEVNV